MEDMERYGDYNEVDEEPKEGKKNIVGLVIKILIAVVCVSVIGVVGFRIFIFNSYPDEVSRVIYTDGLKQHYLATGGDIGAMTQGADVKYDSAEEGNFFFDKLVVVPSADHLQVTVRYNTSLMLTIKEKYGVELDPDKDPTELFEFKLVRTRSDYTPPEDGSFEPVPTEAVGTLGATASAESFMYRYVRLAFDGVDLGLDEGETPLGWVRLDITIKGAEEKRTYSLPVYVGEKPLTEYKLSAKEVPADA